MKIAQASPAFLPMLVVMPAQPPPKPTGSLHHVQFNESDLALAESVASFLAAGVTGGGCAVIVAAPDHCAAFMSALRSRGIDADTLQAESRLIVCDADELLSRFMVNGMPDPGRFTPAIASVLDVLAPGTGEVRIYGEMVARLWDRGNVPAAIALEDHWNNLGRERAFELLCAYPCALSTTRSSAPRSRAYVNSMGT